MRYSDTLQLFDQAFTFPAEKAAVVDQLGGVELTSPAGGDVTVAEILARTDEQQYASPEDLYTSLVGNLEDGFIGRKYYDDRSGTRAGVESVRGDDISL